jgi:hypothetical protein
LSTNSDRGGGHDHHVGIAVTGALVPQDNTKKPHEANVDAQAAQMARPVQA